MRSLKIVVPARLRVLSVLCAAISVATVAAVVVVALDRSPRSHPVSVARLIARANHDRREAYLQHEERVRQRWLGSPKAKGQRAASRTAFHDLSARRSRALYVDDFRRDVAHVVANPASSPVVKNRVVRYLNNSSAVVSAGHRERLVYSSVPLRTRQPDGPYAPVDLSVVRTRRGYGAANPVQPVTIGGHLSAGVRIGDAGFGLTMAGADQTGQLAGAQGVFYPGVATDVDASVVPTINGAEMFTMLRSRFSPQTISYTLSLPPGATARLIAGVVRIQRGGKLLADVRPVTAHDAQATPVPAAERLEGSRLVVTVRHRAGSYAYPILVDPAADVPPSGDGWSFGSSGTASSETATGVSPGVVSMTGDGALDEHADACWVWSMSPKYPVVYDEFDDMQMQVGPTVTVYPPPQPSPPHENTIYSWQPGPWGSWDANESPSCADAYGIWSGFTHAPATGAGEANFSDATESETHYPPEPIPRFGVVIRLSEQSGAYPEVIAPSYATLSVGAVLIETTYTTNKPLGGGGGCPGCTSGPNNPWSGPSNPAQPGQQRKHCGDPVNCATGNRYETVTDLHLPGRSGGLALTRTYNAPELQISPLGGIQPGGLSAGPSGGSDSGAPLAAGQGQDGASTDSSGSSDSGSGGAGLAGPPPGSPGTTSEPASGGAPATPPLGMFGYGWSSSFSAHLVVDQSSGDATVYQDNGSTTAFTSGGGGLFTPVSSLTQASLTQNSDGTYTYTLPDQSTLDFDATGRLAGESDPYGNATTLSYDVQGRLATITDTAGRSISLSYNSDGTVSEASDSAGQHVAYSYTNGDLTSVTDIAGNTWSYGYDSAHNMTTNTDPLGHTVTTEYDAQNRVVSQTDAMGRTMTWAYSVGSAGYATVVTDPAGHETIYQFDDQFDPTSVTRSDGTSTFSYYDQNQNLTGVQDARGAYTSYAYDQAGNMVSQSGPNWGEDTTWTYEARHHVTSMTDPLGRTTNYTYQGNELTSITQTGAASNSGGGGGPTGGGSGGGCCAVASAYRFAPDKRLVIDPQFGYDANGDVTSMTDDNGHTWTYTYDAAGNQTSASTPEGETTSSSYDAAGYLTQTVSPKGGTTTYTNNAYGQPTDLVDPLGHETKASYDADGNLVSVTDADGHTTTYTYDENNEGTATRQPDGTTLGTSYNSDGQIATQTDGAGNTTSYNYNDLGELTSITDPLGRTTSYAYDQAGDLTSMTDPAGRTTTFNYNNDGNVYSIYYSDGTPAVYFGYDADGERISMTDGSGWTGYTYDPLGRMISTTDGAGNTINYTYDPNGNVTSITYPDGKNVTRSFDGDNRLTSVTDWSARTTSFAYDADSNLTSTTFPTAAGNVDNYTYNQADELTGIQMTRAASPLASLSYTLDPNGLAASDTEAGLPQPADQPTTSQGYDSSGNMNGETDDSYDAAGELTSSQTGSYGYDQEGERVSTMPVSGGSGSRYSYDQAGNLTAYTPPAGNPTNYAYNGDGLLASTTHGADTAAFTWDQSGGLAQMLTDGSSDYVYGPGGLPVEQIDKQGEINYLHHDRLGSTRLSTDSTGNKTGAYSYDAYGRPDATTGSSLMPLGYAGQYTEPQSGLIYLRARYYDPQTGQFTSRDPLESATRQPYSYAENNPVNATDPSGLDGIFGGACNPWDLACDFSWDVNHPKQFLGTASTWTGVCAGVMFWNPVGGGCAAVSTITGVAKTGIDTSDALNGSGCWTTVGTDVIGNLLSLTGGRLVDAGRPLAEQGATQLALSGIRNSFSGASKVLAGTVTATAGGGLQLGGAAVTNLPASRPTTIFGVSR
jgi:RHS repeat-associated protein